MSQLKAECLIKFRTPTEKSVASNEMRSQRVILTKLHDIFGITLELVGGRSSVNFDDAGLNLSYSLEGNDKEEITTKANELLKKLNLLATIQSSEETNPFILKEILYEEELINIDSLDNLFYEIEPKLFQKFLLDSNFEEFFVLIEAFNDLKNHRIFDAFPKFVNWLDYYDYENVEKKPQFKFCILRTALSHTQLKNTEKVKEMHPDIEFSGNIFVRNQHNEQVLFSLIPELIAAVQKRFREILLQFVT